MIMVDLIRTNFLRYLNGKAYVDNDQTIEILMSDLDEEVMEIFFKSNTATAELATKKSGINKLLPGMKIDSCLFEPCGYSLNAILDDEVCSGGLGEYATIHVTPEVAFSYVSFETNRLVENYMELIENVVKTFKPGKLMVTFYATRTSPAINFHEDLKNCNKVNEFRRNDVQFCSFQDCDMTYAHFCKPIF